MQDNAGKLRDMRIDGIKLFLIFLVVLGHLSYDDYGIKINRIIYSFHMPAFVFLSGYLTSFKSITSRRIAWVKSTILIYLVAQLFHVLLSFLLGESISWHLLIVPHLAMWYLICLIYWRLSAWLFMEKYSDFWILSLPLILSIAAGFVPLDESFSFQRAFAFFPFFVIGILFKKYNLAVKIDKVPLAIAIAILLISLLATRIIPVTYMPKYHYDNWHQMEYRIIHTCLAILLCLSIFRLSKFLSWRYLAQFGR